MHRSTAKPTESSTTNLLIVFCLVAATTLSYHPLSDSLFFAWDDAEYVYDNRHIRSGFSLESVAWAFKDTSTGNWHPLTWLSLMADHTLYGLNPRGYHATNLFFHIASAVLLFSVLLRLTARRWESAAAAALLALHPIHVESVAWIAERKDVLSIFLGMLTISAYIGYARNRSLRSFLPVVFVYGLGLMAKATLVTLPFVLLLLDYWPLKRFSVPLTSVNKRALYQCLSEKLPLYLLSAGICIATYLAQQDAGWVKQVYLATRVGNSLVFYVTYLVKAVWPAKLGIMYPYPPGNLYAVTQIAGCAVLLLLGTIAAARYIRRLPYIAVGFLWYIGTLVPMIGLVRIGEHAVADRYAYLPFIGIYILAVWLVSEAVASLRSRHRAPAVLLVALAVYPLLGLRTFAQAGYWRDSVSLFEHTLEATGANPLVHNDLGTVLLDRGEIDKAAYHYRQAIGIWAAYPKAHKNLADLLMHRGQTRSAERHYLQAIDARADYLEAYSNLSQLYYRENRLEKARETLEKALALAPDTHWLHTNMAILLSSAGKPDQAEDHFAAALRINPEDGELHYRYGLFLTSVGRNGEADHHFAESIRLR